MQAVVSKRRCLESLQSENHYGVGMGGFPDLHGHTILNSEQHARLVCRRLEKLAIPALMMQLLAEDSCWP